MTVIADARSYDGRPSRLLDPFVSLAFWTLAVATLLNVEGFFRGLIPSLPFFGLVTACCVLLLGVSHVRISQALGGPGGLIIAATASYLAIGFVVAVVTGTEARGSGAYRQTTYVTIFLSVTLAAAVGSRAFLDRVGFETFLKWVLLILMASCVAVLASPILIDVGIAVPKQGYIGASFRNMGPFAGPNEAAYIGCMTALLAIAFLGNGRQRFLGYLALNLGVLSVILSVSKTGVIGLAALFVFFLLLNGRDGRVRILYWFGGALLCLAPALFVAFDGLIILHPGHLERALEIQHLASGDFSQSGVFTGRTTVWSLGLQKVLEAPVVGHGIGHLGRLQGAHLSYEGFPTGVHNMYLRLAGEAGIVPLALYLLYFFSLLRLRWTVPKSLARDVVVGWAILFALFSFSLHHLLSLKYLAFCVGLTSAIGAVLMEDLRRSPHRLHGGARATA